MSVTGWKGQPSKFANSVRLLVGRASHKSIETVASNISNAGKANIAGAGFSRRWQEGLIVSVYPKGTDVAINSQVYVRHKNNLAGVFEFGATIGGSPLMWLPMPDTPKKIGNRPTKPRLYSERVAPLRFAKTKSGIPLLGTRSAATGKFVPVFHGVRSITIGKKFSIIEICAREADKLPSLFSANLGR